MASEDISCVRSYVTQAENPLPQQSLRYGKNDATSLISWSPRGETGSGFIAMLMENAEIMAPFREVRCTAREVRC
jgi:hypothetical protein